MRPIDDERRRYEAARLGLVLFLVSLAMLFGAAVLGFLVVRLAPDHRGAWQGLSLPWELWLSTALLAMSSVALERAVRSVRRGDQAALRRWMWTAMACGVAFLGAQAWCWLVLLRAAPWPAGAVGAASNTVALAAWLFFVLTGLHALHIVGGLAPMAVATRRSMRRRYTARSHAGLLHLRLYWHFLGLVWLGLLATLIVAA